MITMAKAIRALQPNAEFSYDNEDYSTLRWDTPEITIPTEEQIQAKLTELQADFDYKQYQRDRASQYPSIQEQLDMQYHDAINGTTTWKDAIAKVKTDNPKPSE